MDRVQKLRGFLNSVFIGSAMYASYLYGATSDPVGKALAILAGILTGAGAAHLLALALVACRRFRRFLMGMYYIEGYWDLTTDETQYDRENPGNPTKKLNHRGVMVIDYDFLKDEYSVVVVRLDSDGKKFSTITDNCHMSQAVNSVRYLNYFRMQDSQSPSMCICTGKLFRVKRENKRVDTFAALMYAPHSEVRNQSAVRISYETRLKYTDNQNRWITRFLTESEPMKPDIPDHIKEEFSPTSL